jgi:Na+/proline symporter
MAVGVFVLKAFPNLLGGLIFGAMVAAILSTADSFLILASSSFARDLYQQWLWPLYIKKEKYAFNELKLARIATAVIGILVYFIALKRITMIVFLGILGWSIFVSTIFVPIMGGLFWRKANKGGGILATWVGIIMCVGLGLLEILKNYDFWLTAGAWGVIASAIAFLIGNNIYSRRTKRSLEMKEAAA